MPKGVAEPAEVRFWRFVHKTDGCWLWTGGTKNGYGEIKVNDSPVGAHRFSYEMAHGPIPEGLMACHHCDTPLCVRPDHLYAGTRLDNAQDAVRRGRIVPMRGDLCGRHKLTWAEVWEIRASSDSNRELGKRYGVWNSTISRLRAGLSWATE